MSTSNDHHVRQGPDLNWLADIVLNVYGRPNEVLLRVTPAYADELCALLEAEGLRAYPALEHSVVNGPMLEILSVPAAGAVAWAVRDVVLAFMAGNKDKEFTVVTPNYMVTVKGTSGTEAVRTVEAMTDKLERLQQAIEAECAKVTNYHGPVFNGDMTGAQVAWGNEAVTQNQQNASRTVAPGYEALAKLVTDLLQQFPQVGLAEAELRDAEEAGNEVLVEITGTKAPEPGRLRRAVRGLRGILAPIATGVVAGTAAGAQDWAKASIEALHSITF
ncbi:hypothetical protein [Amycolatopsis sp. NPDC003731]